MGIADAANQNETFNKTKTSEQLLQEHERYLFSIYIYPFVFTIFYMVVGVIGNSIVIYIFAANGKMSKTTIFILTLAGIDLISCLVNMPAESAMLWHPVDFDHDVICKLSRYTTYIASASSSFVLIAIAVDRYLMICRPFLGRELGVLYAKRTCLVAVLLGMITTCPSLIFYGTYTYTVAQTDNTTGALVEFQGRTCLISNYYVIHQELPAGFYFFLFGAHIIMFVILIMLYLLIGRSLFISTNTSSCVSDEKRHSLKLFGLSMISAFTGTVPNSPGDKISLGSRCSRTASIENIHRIDHRHSSSANYKTQESRISAETTVSIVLNDTKELRNDAYTKLDKAEVLIKDDLPQIQQNSVKFSMQGSYSNDNDNKGRSVLQMNTRLSIAKSQPSDVISDNSVTNILTKQEMKLNNENNDQLDDNRKLSSGPTSGSILTPMAQMTPNSVMGIFYQRQSVESSARLNRLIMDELRQTEFKETSLRKNTLMMRMVTIAFVVSFLPFLIIVTLRYSNQDIPTHLSAAKQITYHVFLRTYFINSMINPFIYGFMNIEFRSKLKLMFCKPCSSPAYA